MSGYESGGWPGYDGVPATQTYGADGSIIITAIIDRSNAGSNQGRSFYQTITNAASDLWNYKVGGDVSASDVFVGFKKVNQQLWKDYGRPAVDSTIRSLTGGNYKLTALQTDVSNALSATKAVYNHYDRRYNITTRLIGAARAAGGGMEMASGFALGTSSPATGPGAVVLGPAGALVMAHGFDQTQAGLRQMTSGQIVQSQTEKALAASGLMKPETAAKVDGYVSVVTTLGASAVTNAPRVLAANGPRIAWPAAERGFISGDAGVIFAKGRAAAAGDLAALGEINAAKALRAEGINVRFQATASELGIQGVRTPDFLVGGASRTGAGGIGYDVLTPTTGNAGRIAGAIGTKLSQADRVIINLDRTSVTASELSNIVPRVNGIPGLSRPLQEAIIVQNGRVVVRYGR